MEGVCEKSGETSSSKEEFRVVIKLTEYQKKALHDLKSLIKNDPGDDLFCSFEGSHATIWGVPLLGHTKSDSVILKFLKARNFEVFDAYAMIMNTLLWRDEVGIELLLQDDVGIHDNKSVMFTHGYDKEGYPVWYLVLEDVLVNNRSQITSYDDQEGRKFFRWLIQFTEKNVRKIVCSTRGQNSILLVIDLKSLTRYGNRDLYKVIYKYLQMLSDYYPEFVAKQLWINVAWWYRNYCRVYSMVFDAWSTNQVVFSGQTKTIETLFTYISPVQVPVKYGGLSRDNEQDFHQSSTDDISPDVTINPSATQRLEFHFTKPCKVIWDLRMISWDAVYEAKFEPDSKESYTTAISRPRKLTANDEPVISEGFSVDEPGKLVLAICNISSKKKKLLTRVRVVSSEMNTEPEASLRGWLVQSDDESSMIC
uniref:CRAL-TRIO domain-containing protein n=1 Tax=Chenopodium quinoa TaxID=63459 RepID=A0A803KZZ3_CHEQI